MKPITTSLLLILFLLATGCAMNVAPPPEPTPSQWDVVRGSQIAANLHEEFSGKAEGFKANYVDEIDRGTLVVTGADAETQAEILEWVTTQRGEFNMKPLDVIFK